MTKAVLGGLGGHARKSALAVLGAMLLGILLLAVPAWAGAVRFSSAPITINDAAAASPYPSTIEVTDLPNRPITDLNVTLHGISHAVPDDLDILLKGPGGQKVMLMSDAGGHEDLTSQVLTFDDDPPGTIPGDSLGNRRVQPTNYGSPDNMPTPAPAEPYASSLSAFDGATPQRHLEPGHHGRPDERRLR